MRVTADINIYVSAVLFGGKPLTLLKLGYSRGLQRFISDDIIEETLGVLREKFKRSRERIIVAEELLRACTYWVLRPSGSMLFRTMKTTTEDSNALWPPAAITSAPATGTCSGLRGIAGSRSRESASFWSDCQGSRDWNSKVSA